MAKGVHNATSGYKRGKGKNGGGLPGQVSGKRPSKGSVAIKNTVASLSSRNSARVAAKREKYGSIVRGDRLTRKQINARNARSSKRQANIALAGAVVYAGAHIAAKSRAADVRLARTFVSSSNSTMAGRRVLPPGFSGKNANKKIGSSFDRAFLKRNGIRPPNLGS